MKTNSLRKKRRLSAKNATKRIRKPRLPLIDINGRVVTEFSGGVDDHEALLVEESLDERERRG